ncbi:hypothetical protein CRYUN_Cryun22dG0019500 [Craigia yunnanensis]
MENSSTVMKERLGFFKIIKESLKIPFKNPNFILFTFLTSLPLFCFLVLYEIILQHILIETGKILQETADPFRIFGDDYLRLRDIGELLEEVSPKVLLLGFLYLGVLHCLDLFNTIATVDVASIIYTGEKSITLKEMFFRPFKETRFKRTLITSICSLSLAFLILLGLLSFATYIYITSADVLFMMLFVVLFIALLGKYMEWGAIWNMGIVISVLEEKQGDVALLVSSYLSRCNRACGFFLMLGFFSWRFALRFSCLYEGWNNGGSNLVVTAVHISLVCLSNVLKWFVIWIVIPTTRNSRTDHVNNTIALIVLLQYVPRLFIIFPLNQKIIKSTGVVAKNPFTALRVLGAIWYLCSIARQFSCWKAECARENISRFLACIPSFLDCNSLTRPERQYWVNVTNVLANCDGTNNHVDFKFGMYAYAFTNDVASKNFVIKYLYCLWWGIRNLRFDHWHNCPAIRLVSSLSTEGHYIVREGDPVNEMLFIIRGQHESSTTNGGRSGFFNSITLRPGDFCGEELLTWALMPNSSLNLPSSTRTVRAVSEVEVFALHAENLQFSLISSSGFKFKKRKLAKELIARERSFYYRSLPDQRNYYIDDDIEDGLGYEDENIGRTSTDIPNNFHLKMPKFFKPDEPDFSVDHIEDV